MICSTDFDPALGYRYEIDRSTSLKNWYVQLDLTCVGSTKVSIVGSAYFIGFSLGILLIELPSRLGKKGAMNAILPVYVFASAITVYARSLEAKAFGLFVQGFLHLKITLCYAHILELVPEAYKGLSATVITAFDASSLAICGLFFTFVSKDLVKFMENANLVGAAACCLYLAIAPESPHWLIMKKRYKYGI